MAHSKANVLIHLVWGTRDRWQRGDGAFSVTERDPSAVLAYVRDQRERHATNRVEPEWEQWWVEEGED